MLRRLICLVTSLVINFMLPLKFLVLFKIGHVSGHSFMRLQSLLLAAQKDLIFYLRNTHATNFLGLPAEDLFISGIKHSVLTV